MRAHCEVYGRWTRLRAALHGDVLRPTSLLIDYDRLRARPAAGAARIARWLGLPISRNTAARIAAATSARQMRASEKYAGGLGRRPGAKAEAAPRVRAAGSTTWRDVLRNPAAVAACAGESALAQDAFAALIPPLTNTEPQGMTPPD